MGEVTTRHPAFWLAVLALCLGVPRVSVADSPGEDDRARELFYIGDDHYAAGRYEQALHYFEQAYSLSERPELLYNIANAHERMGDYTRAAEFLKRYVQSPEAVDVSSVRERIRRLEANARAQHKTAGQTVPVTRPAFAGPREPGPAPKTSKRSRRAGILLLSGGGAALFTAVVFGVASRSAAADAQDACLTDGLCRQVAEDAVDREHRFALVADISAAVGLVSAGVGSYLLFVRGDSPSDRGPRIAPAVTPGGIGIGLAAEF